MNKNFVLILVAVVGLMAGLFVVSGGKDDSAVVNTEFEGDAKVVQADDHVQGPADAKVTIIEYGDFECPACLAFFPNITQLKQERGDDFQFVFRHLPLTQIHPNALAAHRASEAAHNQGKFWEMHDLLYENQRSWSANGGSDIGDATAFFEGLAEQLALDMEQYRADFSSDEVLQKINKFTASGEQFDATATPTLILNGEKIATPPTYDALVALLDAELGIEAPAAEEATPEDSEE